MIVRIIDRVHKNYVVLRCPPEVRATIGQEPIKCALIASSIEVEVKRPIIGRLIPLIKPRVIFVREPGIYDYFYDGRELIIHGVITVEGSRVIVKPDIVFQDMAEYKTVSEFVRAAYDKFDALFSKALGVVSDLVNNSISVLSHNVEVIQKVSNMIGEEGRYNVAVTSLINSILASRGMSLQTAKQIFDTVMKNYGYLVTMPPKPPTQTQPVVTATPEQQPQQPQAVQGFIEVDGRNKLRIRRGGDDVVEVVIE